MFTRVPTRVRWGFLVAAVGLLGASMLAAAIVPLSTAYGLAEAVGVSRQSINSIERNRYVPSLPLALLFSRVFARPTDEIFELEVEP